MKVQYRIGPKVLIEADGATVKEVFDQLGALADVFAAADKCGCCGAGEIVPHVREPQGFTYYELLCLSCGARLPLGQTKEGGQLFPKRRDEQGHAKDKGGWEKWQQLQEPPPPAAPPQQRAPQPPAQTAPAQQRTAPPPQRTPPPGRPQAAAASAPPRRGY